MPCFHPLPAWRTFKGTVTLKRETAYAHPLQLPCGGCVGCRAAKAKAWALRCHLELAQHPTASFTTLTYDDAHLPATLSRRDLQLWLKRFRKALGPARPVRFFGAGEYGEKNGRPHYHAILFGVGPDTRSIVEKTWGLGHTRTEIISPRRIAYCAGYTVKKIAKRHHWSYDVVDQETGEYLYTYQPPFLQMSRQPGIGGWARTHAQSWREYAIHEGQKQPVPRFLHNAWRKTATSEQIEKLIHEKLQIIKPLTPQQLIAAEKIHLAKTQQDAMSRNL